MNKNVKEEQKNPNTALQDALYTCRLMVRYILLFGGFINCLMLSTPMYSMQVLDRVISTGNMHTLTMLTVVVVSAIAFMCLLQLSREFAIVRMGDWFQKQMAERLFCASVRNAVNHNVSVGAQNIQDLQTIKNCLLYTSDAADD